MLPRLVAFLSLIVVVSSQCAFNALSIRAGTNRFTGLTIASAFGGNTLVVTSSSGQAADCALNGNTAEGATCTIAKKPGTQSYSDNIVAKCTNGKYVYTPAAATLTPEACKVANTGSAGTIAHLFGEEGIYSCAMGKSCSVEKCKSYCNAGTVSPVVNCNDDCTLGTKIGQVVTTKLVGSGGADCSGSTIPMAPNSPTCVVSAVAGYTCAPVGMGTQTLPATVTCTVAGATLIANSCTENVCSSLALSSIAGAIGDTTNNDECGSTVVLSAVTDTSCDVKCDQSAGYVAQTGTITCANKAGGVAPVSSITKCVAVACPPNSTLKNLKHCVCNEGYSGVITYTGVTYSGSCSLIKCDAYIFPTNPSNLVAGDTDGCKGNDILSINDKTCSVKCAPEYVPATGVVTCDYATTKKSTTPLTCTEKACSAYTFGTGIAAGANNGCTSPVTLKQATSPSCTLACAPGYSGVDGTLTCPNTLATGAAPVVSITCTENTCSAYNLKLGEVATAPGCGSLKTVTGNTCTVTCDTGFTVGTGTVKCPSNAINNQVPTVESSPNCRRTCTLHTCSKGYRSKAATTVCDAKGCTDATCCDTVACPANSKTAQTDTTLNPPTCECLSGFMGTASWDSSGRSWSHKCVAHCANTFFAGCDANKESLVSNPSSILCGNGNCDTNGCPACTQKNCCVENTCVAPGTTLPNHAFGGQQGDKCTTVASCSPVTCTDGYKGTPVLQCKTPGGKFTLNPSCVASECPKWAGPPGTCACNAGYRVKGGGNPVFNKSTREWTHTCELTCAHSAVTACSNQPGVTLVEKPGEVVCTGSSGTPKVDCTAAVCCRDTCANSKFSCPSTGFLTKSNPSSIVCPAAGCDQSTCCLASCDNSGFSGCAAPGLVAKANPKSIPCGTNTASSCTTSICCHATTCDKVTCPAGTQAVSPKPSCSTCTETICCRENTCKALTAGQFPNYIIAGGTSCTTVSGCNPVACRVGYHGKPAPQLLCLADGGSFTASGCVENVCQSTSLLPKYVTATSPCTSVSNCGSVSCAPGYKANGNTPSVACVTDGKSLTGTGCIENVCKPPGTAGITGVTFTGSNTCTTVSSCGTISCARGYDSMGTPSISCLQEGSNFEASGCLSKTCKPHLTSPHEGYSVVIPTCTSVEKCGKVSCDIGYEQDGIPSIVCPITNGNFEYSGCKRVSCPTGASGTQCICDNGYTGTPKWESSSNSWTHTCTKLDCPRFSSGVGCPCLTGYTGTPAWSGSKWTHTCTLASCGLNQNNAPNCQCDAGFSGTPKWGGSSWDNACTAFTCSKGLSTSIDSRYTIANAPCSSVASCGAVTCKSGYIPNNPRLVCESQNGFLTAVGCDTVACPAGAGPVGTCRCLKGYVGNPSPTFNGQVWTGSCDAKPCPTNSNGLGSCNCLSGYIGNPQWSGSAWTHTCQLSSCPSNAAGAPSCVCNSGFTGTLVWSSSSNTWSGRCLSSTCPANSARNANNVCVCNNGYKGLVNGVGTCSAVACPTGASPVGICACPGGSPAPVWNSVTESWTHVCSTASCGSNSVLSNGVCVCVQGYSGKVNGVGSCTAVACPEGASPIGVCNCPVGGPSPVWNSATGAWTHACNIAPTVTLSRTVVNIDPSSSDLSIPGFLTTVAAPEGSQRLTLSCTAVTPALFSVQPALTLVGTTATLTLTKSPTATSGSSSVTCSITDNGTPVMSTDVVFNVVIATSVLPCGTVGGRCSFPSTVQVGVLSTYDSSFLVTSGTTTTCTAENAALLTTQPTISSSGRLTFASGGNAGTTPVSCVTTVTGATSGTTFSFTINVVASGNQWFRVRVATSLTAFAPSSLQTAVMDILNRAGISIFGIDIKYACPASACGATSTSLPVQSLVCPQSHDLRVAASCLFEFGNERRLELLQAAANDAVIDFDIISRQPDDSQTKQAERASALSALNTEATRCNSGSSSCAFTQNNVPLVTGSNVALTPVTSGSTPIPPVVTGNDDDDGMPWWGWVLIAAGITLCCCLLVVSYFFCFKKKDDNSKLNYQEKEMNPTVRPRTADPSYSYDSYYGTSYSSSYVPETFAPGEKVTAQYIDGAVYEAEVLSQEADGTYSLKWYDGSHSQGVPADQINRP